MQPNSPPGDGAGAQNYILVNRELAAIGLVRLIDDEAVEDEDAVREWHEAEALAEAHAMQSNLGPNESEADAESGAEDDDVEEALRQQRRKLYQESQLQQKQLAQHTQN